MVENYTSADRFVIPYHTGMEPIQHQPITGDRASIAVLPFRNLSRDSDDVYISDGIAEEITGALAVLPGLRVAARESAFSFRDSAEPPAAVAAKLGVAMLLGGSARREGSRVRLAVHLIDPGTGGTIWSEEREIELSDLYAARVEIAQAVAEHLVASTPTVLGKAPRD